jgi:2,3-bisphosphoglycerate-independent phosphoglycerate mutase
MKGVLVILDGLGDLPCEQLGGKTPLESAITPNMDFLAERGKLGLMHAVRQNFIPSSDEGTLCIFGNDLLAASRGQMESAGIGISLKQGDLAMRINFATINNIKEGMVIDRRVARTLTTKEASILAREIQSKVNIQNPFIFESTVQHRGVLVLRGGMSEMISNNDISDYSRGKHHVRERIQQIKPLDDSDNALYTANVLNELIEQAYNILENHPINLERKKKGLLPANYLLIRGAGTEKPNLEQYKKWIAMAYMPLEIGFAELSGMKVVSFNYPKLKGLDVYKNLKKALKKACKTAIKTIRKNGKKFDYAYIHIKETDLPGHDNKPIEKKQMIEYIDKTLFSYLKKYAIKNKIKIAVSADHSTPCNLKSHSAHPVPVLLYTGEKPEKKRFTEEDAKKGVLGTIQGKELLKSIGFRK